MVNLSKYSPYPGDRIPAVLEDGEYVLNRNAVKAIGKKKLDRINNVEEPRFPKGYQTGGGIYARGTEVAKRIKRGRDGLFSQEQIMKYPARGEGEGGDRYYLGKAKSPKMSMANSEADFDAFAKYVESPQDSIPASEAKYYFDSKPKKLLNKIIGRQKGGFMENAGFPTQNKFKLGLARKMAKGGLATRDAQKKRNSMNDKEYSDFIQNMNAPLEYQPELPGQYPQNRFNNDLADSLYNANFDSLEADYIGKNPYNFMQGPKELQGPQQNPNVRYISDREAERRGFGEDPYYEADYISDEQASKMGFDIPENVQGPEERMSLANLNLDNYTDEFGLDGGNLNLPRPADSFEIRKGDNEFDYPSEVEGSLPENQPKSLLGVYAKKYADRMDKAVDAIEPSMQMVGERGIEAGSKAGVLAKDIASQVKGLPKDTKRKASSLFNRVKKKFNTGKKQGKYYKDNTSIKSKSNSKSNTGSVKKSEEIKKKVTNKKREWQGPPQPIGPTLPPKPTKKVSEKSYMDARAEKKRAKWGKNKKETSSSSRASKGFYQEGGKVDSMKRPGGYSIGTPNVEKIMKQNLKKIQSDKVIKDRLKQRAKGDMKLYRKHVKVREENGSLLTPKEVQRTLQYFANKTGARKMQEGGMVNSTGGAMSGTQMNSRRLLSMANRRKNVRN